MHHTAWRIIPMLGRHRAGGCPSAQDTGAGRVFPLKLHPHRARRSPQPQTSMGQGRESCSILLTPVGSFSDQTITGPAAVIRNVPHVSAAGILPRR